MSTSDAMTEPGFYVLDGQAARRDQMAGAMARRAAARIVDNHSHEVQEA